MSVCTPEEANCGRRHRLPHWHGAHSSSVLAQRSWFTVCPPAVVVDEASDVAFPGGIAPTVKTRASPADQYGRGKDHRLPCHVCDSYRVHTGLRYRRGRIDAVAIAVHPNRQRITG